MRKPAPSDLLLHPLAIPRVIAAASLLAIVVLGIFLGLSLGTNRPGRRRRPNPDGPMTVTPVPES